VHYGIRPTDVTLSSTGQGIAATVVVVEPTGAETELLLQVGSSQMVVVIHGRTDVQPDQTVHLAVEPAKAHVFDMGNGGRLN
jgi:multiple sugar transport system ATP-binding protein